MRTAAPNRHCAFSATKWATTQKAAYVPRHISGQALLAIVLGCIALLIGKFALGFLFGFFGAVFGWGMPTPTATNLILIAVLVIALLIYRNRRNRRPAPPPVGGWFGKWWMALC
jgi:hypothetical protein